MYLLSLLDFINNYWGRQENSTLRQDADSDEERRDSERSFEEGNTLKFAEETIIVQPLRYF